MKRFGKALRGSVYFHRDAWPEARAQFPAVLAGAIEAHLETTEREFNVLRVDRGSSLVSFLAYEHFFEAPFPELARSRLHNLKTGAVSERRYGLNGNPPILHRKELLLAPTDERRGPFALLTGQLEAAGLLEKPSLIGYKNAWVERLKNNGFAVRDGLLQKQESDYG